MSNKPRGLGRGLGDLLADNAPEVRSSSVVRRDEHGEVSISHVAEPSPRKSTGDEYADGENNRPLVFPKVTPIVGGASHTEEQSEETDEAREILEADAAITGKPIEDSFLNSGASKSSASNESGAEKAEDTVVYPRSLKAVFRNFK